MLQRKTPPEPAPRLIRDKAFARRINEACDQNKHVPAYNFGRLSWVRDHLISEHRVKVSIETVRKWFAGESRPRPDKMRKLAALLKVDEAWLSLGITPEMAPDARSAFNAAASGAVNLVAGLIQLNGGHPAFPEEGDERGKNSNLYAIIKGKSHDFYVTLGHEDDGSFLFTLPADHANSVCIGVVQTGPLRCDFIRFDSNLLDKHADNKGGFAEVTVKRDGGEYATRRDHWEKIKTFKERF